MNKQLTATFKQIGTLLGLGTALLMSVAVLVACTGGDDSSGLPGLDDLGDGLSTLSFNDANFVSGLEYVNGSNSGTTNAQGEFPFDPSESISFSIGGIDLGTIAPSTIGNSTTIDTSYFDAANVGSITDETGNISQLLQSLDNDADIANGISIPSSVSSEAASMDFDFSLPPVDFETTYQTDVNTLTAPTSAGERDFMDRDTTDSNLQYFLDTGDPLAVDMYCTTTNNFGDCAYYITCVPNDPADFDAYDGYYEADDGRRFYFDNGDVDSITAAAQALVDYCNN